MKTLAFTKMGLVITSLALAAACGSQVQGGGGGLGGATASTTGTTSTTDTTLTTSGNTTSGSTTSGNTTSGSTTGTSCPNVTPPSGPCAPGSSCPFASSPCLAEAPPPAAPPWALRMAQITFTAPKAFTAGIVTSVISGAVTPQNAACNLSGTATFSWLLRVDAGGAVTTGGARPVQPGQPYQFSSEVVSTGAGSFSIAPVTLAGALGAGCVVQAGSGDVNIPIYLDVAATQLVLLPLRALRFHDAIVMAGGTCIGWYNAAGLEPVNACLPDSTHPSFVDGGQVEAFINLADADAVVIPPLQETLCVLLSGDPAQWGDGGQPNRCKKNGANQIAFQGDVCTATNQPATPGCADAVRLAASFAASAVALQ